MTQMELKEEIEIKGEYPEWRITFKDKIYPIYIPTRVRPLQGEDIKKYLIYSFGFALAQRYFQKCCNATHMDMKRMWEKFCIYNNWECPC